MEVAMKVNGVERSHDRKLTGLIRELHRNDCTIDFAKIEELLSFGKLAAPHLEAILKDALLQSRKINPDKPPKGTEWFVVVHALCLLAHLKSTQSLEIVLHFLGMEQRFLDYWLQDLLSEELWELIYLLSNGQTEPLHSFLLDRKNNPFSRLSVCTALAQMALAGMMKEEECSAILANVLRQDDEDPDFIGLMVSEISVLRNPALKEVSLQSLRTSDVWPGIISEEEIELLYRSPKPPPRYPLSLWQRYTYFRQTAHFPRSSSMRVVREVKERELSNGISGIKVGKTDSD
jgi:hypothetical protein